MTKPIGNPDFSSERAMGEIDKILTSIMEGYGLSRSEAVGCLEWMAVALTEFRPGDPGLEAAFHRHVEDSMDNFEPWAEKVNKAILSWGERP